MRVALARVRLGIVRSVSAQPTAPAAVSSDRFVGSGRDLRMRSARGTIVNAVYLTGSNALTLIKGLAVASLLSTKAYGTWGLVMAGFMTLLLLGDVGIADKYIQQDDPDQRRAFELAFTFQSLLGAVFVVIILAGMPLFALLYGRPAVIAPGMALALAIPAFVLQTPLWVHYRRMDFVRQRKLQLVDPVVSIVAVLALVVAGLGIWGLLLGELLGSWCAAVVVARSSPYALRFRFEKAALKAYTQFSWPLFVGAISTVLLLQVPVTLTSRLIGVAAVGGLALAMNISQFTTRVDTVVTQTLYPAICAVKDRADLLFESFWKSNRLALLWAAPLGAAAAVFAGDFVHYVVGNKWHFAIPLIATFGVNAALNQIGFNWAAYFRALNRTRPVAVAGVLALIAVLGIAVPLLVTQGLTAYAYGMTAATVVGVTVRLWYLRQIFSGLAIATHVARGIGPALFAVAGLLLVRAAAPGGRSVGRVLVEVVIYAALAIGVTYLSERKLLRESVGYLRRARLVGV